MEHNLIIIKNCKHVLIHVRWVIMKFIIYAWHVIQLVLRVPIKVFVRAVPVTEIIHITHKIFISVQQIVV